METFDGNIQVNRYDAEGLRHEMEENGSLVQFIFNQDREVIAEQNSLGITRMMPDSQITILFRKFLADQIKERVKAAMYTADQLYNQLIDCPWLKRCGIPEASLFPFPAAWIQDVDELTRAITSIEWENICLEGCLRSFANKTCADRNPSSCAFY